MRPVSRCGAGRFSCILGSARDVYVRFSLVAIMFGVLLLVVVAFSVYGAYALAASRRRNRAYLAASTDDPPLQLDHVSAPLRRQAAGARTLRISLEGPIRDVIALRTGEFSPSSSTDFESFDAMLIDLSRQVAEWLEEARRLPEVDRARLEDLGASTRAIRSMFEAEGGAFERKHLKRDGMPPLDERLERLANALERFELALQSNGRVYR